MELHAASSIVAYGAFALAGISGVMYLIQERQLKTHHLRSIFYHLPPIHDLAVANRRLILMGFTLLTVGILASFGVGSLSSHAWKIAWSVAVWLQTRGAAPPRSWTEVIGAARLPSPVPSEGSVSWAPAAGTVMQ